MFPPMKAGPDEQLFCDKFSVPVFICSCIFENLPKFYITNEKLARQFLCGKEKRRMQKFVRVHD